MKVLHFILGKANKSRSNGVNQVIAGMAKYLTLHGVDLTVIGKAESVEREGAIIDRDGFAVEAYSKLTLRAIGRFVAGVKTADIVHFHGVYSVYNILASLVCMVNDTPYIITLHDGLSAIRLNQRRRFLKRMFNLLVQNRFVHGAAAIHVLTEEESTDLVNFGYAGKIYVISNGVDLDDFPRIINNQMARRSERLRVGYLGRLAPEKNIGSLISAISIGFTGASVDLILAGPASTYLDTLLKDTSGVSVDHVGSLYGEQKTEFIKSLDLFVHPAYCDVFSIAAMEVLAVGTPLVITRTSDSAYFYNRNAFFMCEPTAFGINRGIQLAIDTRDSWVSKSIEGRLLIDSQFNWSVAAASLKAAYFDIYSLSRK
jgi:glycosyltransferase involved in cell wall biosynthesis